MITAKQKALLHVAKQELGLDDDLYRLILEQEANVSSSKDLTKEGFEKVLKRFRKLGFRRRRKPEERRPRADELPGTRQLKMIEHLYEDLGWREGSRRIGFQKKVIGRPWPQTRAEANKIIEALKSMVARGYKRY